MNRSIRTTLLAVSIISCCLHHAVATSTDLVIDVCKELQNVVTTDQGYQAFVTFFNKEYPRTIDSSGIIVDARNIFKKIDIVDFLNDLIEDNNESYAAQLKAKYQMLNDTMGSLELYCMVADEIAERLTEKQIQQKYPNPVGLPFRQYLIDCITLSTKNFTTVIQKFDRFIETTFVS